MYTVAAKRCKIILVSLNRMENGDFTRSAQRKIEEMAHPLYGSV